MSIKEASKQKPKTELELVQAKNAITEVRIHYAKQADELEQKVTATKANLKELGEGSDEAWAYLIESPIQQTYFKIPDLIRQPTSNRMPTLVEMTSIAFLIAGIMGTVWNMFGVT